MKKKTKFEEELSRTSSDFITIDTAIILCRGKDISEIAMNAFFNLSVISNRLNSMHDFLIKYNDFFKILDKKFGTSSMKSVESCTKIVVVMKKEVEQIVTFLSQKKFKVAEGILGDLSDSFEHLQNDFSVISALPYKIDYSKLSNKDWKMIGVAGVHYKSKVFLSYYFRDADPRKDENQKLIDYYVKPTLKLLNIEPVTARGYLKSQELIDDKVTELIEDCDGIVGFYTKGDSIENVEHELSKNSNIVAICKEEGAKAPSMRLSRLLINFERDQIGYFLIQLIGCLKNKGLFRLVV